MTGNKSIKEIVVAIEKALKEFQKAIPGIQKGIFKELLGQLNRLEVKDDKLLNRSGNLRLIGEIRYKLERIILSPEYKEAVKKYIESFKEIEQLQQNYFAEFNYKFKPKSTLKIIRELAIERTVNDLMDQGLKVNVLDGVREILQSNITTGGSYADLNEQLRNKILTNETGEGSLERYTKVITTDAINQYSAQYHEALAQDLDLNWGRYVGSNIETSRPFCLALTKKQWVHKSELPDVIKGKFKEFKDEDGKIYVKTGLPSGMIAGTNESNFKIRRGGYQCGHQFFWLPDSAVPEDVKSRFEAQYPGKQKVYRMSMNTPREVKPLKEFNGSLREFVSQVMSTKQTNNTVKTLGSFNDAVLADLKKNGIELAKTEIVISDKRILKYLDHPKAAKGASIDVARFEEVSKAINNPVAILQDLQSKKLVYVFVSEYDAKMLKVIVEPNAKVGGSITNLAKSIGVVTRHTLTDTNSYRTLVGKI